MPYPPIVYPIALEWPDLTVFLLFNVLCAGLSTAVIVVLTVGNPNRLLRPALILSVALNLIFQWPLVLLSNPLLDSLQSPWQFGLFAHLPVLSSVAYVALTSRLDPPRSSFDNTGFVALSAWPIAAMLVLFTAVFLGRVPLDCTALYASIVDPTAALLAREVTIKFAGSTIATAAYGAVANSLAPAMVGVLLLLSLHFVSSRRWLAALLPLLTVLPCITVVLLAGAKGLLVPTFMVGSFAALGAGKTLAVKLLSVVGAVAVLMAAMVSLELARERDGQIVDYDFNSCVARLGAAEEGIALLQSMSKGGLGLSADRIEWYLGEAAASSSSAPAKPITVQRASSYLNSLVQRALVTPLQVASWHKLYVEQQGSPGAAVLPFAKYLFGGSIDITSLVYQAYGVTFSGGDATSTSTAPTSFIFAYPSYFGWAGLIAVIGLIIALDTAMSLASRGLPQGNALIAGGLSAVICYNLLTSDFYTTMVSHGGAIAVCIVSIMRLTQLIVKPATPPGAGSA